MPSGAPSAAAADDSTDSSSSTTTDVQHDLFGYLESLPPATLRSLYASPTDNNNNRLGLYACRAALRRLPELGRQFAIRLTVCGGSFARRDVDRWTRGSGGGSGKREAREAIRKMERLSIVEPRRRPGDDALYDDEEKKDEERSTELEGDLTLSKEFYQGMKASLTTLDSSPWPPVTEEQKAEWIEKENKEKDPQQQGSSSKKSKYKSKPPTMDELELYTRGRWDSVLHFLVGATPTGVEDPPAALVHFLERAGLMQEDPDWDGNDGGDEAPLVITSRGYEFMLHDVHVQVWLFLLRYLRSLPPGREDIRTEALLFLLCLGYCRVGEAYPASCLTKATRILMKDFAQFGLLYLCKIGGSTVFYPTRVAVNLVEGGAAEAAAASSGASSGSGASASATRALESSLAESVPGTAHLAVIVQTNFQLCAYTTSELHVSMLGLFCDVTSYRRLPNVIFYRITRDSIKSAFRLGIEADQILRFLRMHAHPRLRTGDQPLVPSNVEDQIILWDRERHRVTLDDVWVHQCQTAREFRAVRQYASDHGAYAWGNEETNKAYVRHGKAELVSAFVRRWRAREAQRRADADGGGGASRAGGRPSPGVARQSSYV